MPLDFTKPGTIKFLKEKYEHEKDQRVGWFLANKEKLIREATLTDKNKGYSAEDIRRAPLEIFMPVLSGLYKVSAENRRKKVPVDGPVIGIAKDMSITPSPLMKPVEPSVSSILYEQPPKGGRRQYLNARKRKIPDEKYYFCETSANDIGWQWKESALPRRPPKYGRHEIILHEAPRSGPQPDPKHYMQLIPDEKCLK